MPRHTFPLRADVRDAVKKHVSVAIGRLDPSRFNQEANYVAALAHAVEGVAYDGPNGKVSFSSTVFDDRGRNSAESRLGADIAITADMEQEDRQIRKAILVQAKLGVIPDLSTSELNRLRQQVRQMQRHTRSPKVMEIPESDGSREPRILSGRRLIEGGVRHSVPLPSYFTSRVLTTLDGDTRPDFVDAVQDSRATRIDILALFNWRSA
jgi:hypothetical protein